MSKDVFIDSLLISDDFATIDCTLEQALQYTQSFVEDYPQLNTKTTEALLKNLRASRQYLDTIQEDYAAWVKKELEQEDVPKCSKKTADEEPSIPLSEVENILNKLADTLNVDITVVIDD